MSITSEPRSATEPRSTPSGDQHWPGQGILLSNRYRLDEFVAVGSAATVWRAYDVRLQRDVAVKLLLPHRAADEVAVGRFRVEALATVRANHPNAVRVYDARTDGAMTYLVMEFVDGPSLSTCPLPVGPTVAAALGAQVGAALGAAHARGLVHRDVKPANVLLNSTGWIKVVDFGIARVFDDETVATTSNQGMGTARYLAPERLTQGVVGPWTDVYSLGLTLWEVLAGRPAFDGDTVHATTMARIESEVPELEDHAPDVPASLAEIVRRATRRDAKERFPDGDAMAHALLEVCGPRPYELTRSLVAQLMA